MKLADLVRAYDQLEGTSKRTDRRRVLGELFAPLAPKLIVPVVYLSQGILRPEFEGVELGVGASLARRAVVLATGAPDSRVAERLRVRGDLGSVVAELLEARGTPVADSALDLEGVYATLREIARTSGEGSQEQKVTSIVGLLGRASPSEAKYIVRFVLGELRLGVRDQTILDGLSSAFADSDKAARARIEEAYNLSSDLGLVAQALAARGPAGLAEIHLEVGRPIRPMLAEREPDLASILRRMGGTAALEYKYDGLRVQAHVARDGRVRLFSRRLEEIGAQFPDVARALPSALRRHPAIVEGECVPIDPSTGEIRPFQEVSRRRGRKHDLDKVQAEIPVALFLFDVLLDGSEGVYERPFPERRRTLSELVRPNDTIALAEQRTVESVEAATAFFEEAVAAGAEGVMAKSLSPESRYRAGARGFWWIKYKREYTAALGDSIDGVIVGGFHGRGRRAGRFGAFLLAVYDPHRERFESFTKVGTGFDDASLEALSKRMRALAVPHPPPEVETGLVPDAWFRPEVVLEVRGAELTVSPVHRAAMNRVRAGGGLALRFPRFTGRVRDDKGSTDATTSDELLEMYRTQVRRLPPESGAEPAS
ncbi:MAG TPA: ATP-dependent DNA ligase [Thermoplasmata archaeon]|nr:ATP-dependent DNA ligase [Thermoplasmata archaeon]